MTLQAANGPRWVSPDGLIEIRQGRWQEVLADVEACDAVITDPPYSARTHEGHDAVDGTEGNRALAYASWAPDDVRAFVDAWSPRCRGWICAFTSHDLVPSWEAALAAHDRYVFAPVPWISKRVRSVGDGPGSWCCWMVVARPRRKEFLSWGALDGAYLPGKREEQVVQGGKPLWLMEAVLRDYTRPGDLVVDPCGGGFTTARAARALGRRCVSSEAMPDTFAAGLAKVREGVTVDLFAEVAS